MPRKQAIADAQIAQDAPEAQNPPRSTLTAAQRALAVAAANAIRATRDADGLPVGRMPVLSWADMWALADAVLHCHTAHHKPGPGRKPLGERAMTRQERDAKRNALRKKKFDKIVSD